MRRVFAFVVLKVAELLAVFLLFIQAPYCIGIALSYYGVMFQDNAPDFVRFWFMGMAFYLIFVLFTFLLYMLFWYEDP